jgi:hypothetical protein
MSEIEMDWREVTGRHSSFRFVRALIADRMDSLTQEARHPIAPDCALRTRTLTSC